MGIEVLKGKMLLAVETGLLGENEKIPEDSPAYGGVGRQNRQTITFRCDDGAYVFLADGDCCSQTHIDSVEGPRAGRIVDIQQPEWGEPCREVRDDENMECTRFYKTTLVIDGQGHLDIEYRNESNGYYGGSLELLSAPTPGGRR